nr:TerD family protein [Kineococcus vitellinus]
MTVLVVSADGKVAGDDDMVFFNQPAAPGVRLEGITAHLDLGVLRPGADKVVIAVSPERAGATFGGLPVTLTLKHGGEDVRFTPARLSTQTVAVLAEIYQRSNAPGGGQGTQWKVRAVGQGYDEGLAGLATDFGVSIDDAPATNSAPGANAKHEAKYEANHEAHAADVGTARTGKVTAPPFPTPHTSTTLDMSKKPLGAIELTKKGSALIPLDFSKREQARSTVFRVDLEWDGGSARRRSLGADLDLYALWADRAGRTGAVYYRDLGSLNAPPYVRLHGDATAPGRESVEITRPDHLAHVLICAYSAVENGTGSFKSYGARAIVDDASGSRVTVPLFDDSEKYWVAIAKLSFSEEGVRVQQVEDYGRETTESRPLLHADGTFEMGAGPVEFKFEDED